MTENVSTETFLNDAELQVLTGKTRRSSQRLALIKMNIKFFLRPDGQVVVLRAEINGSHSTKLSKSNRLEPNWGATR